MSTVFLNQCTGLVAIEARHHDVDKNHIRLVVGDLRQRIETIFRKDDFAASLHQKNFGAAADGV
jgi:hypothetical protein